MRKWLLTIGAVAITVTAYAAFTVIPGVAAGALLHPARRPVRGQPPGSCKSAAFSGAGVTLNGWRCEVTGQRRGTLVFLHGIADNRESVAGAVDRFVTKGLDVLAYDSRAQGDSSGDACTYGYWEKRDLQKVLDTAHSGPIVLFGTSLGAAVALQEAADDSRVAGIAAAEVFSDLRTVARERAPRFMTEAMIRRAFSIAEARADFRVDDVSPVDAARRLTIPVLLIHGANDTDTPADHSRRVLRALSGPKELLLVPGARHNESLQSPFTWQRIDTWVEEVLLRRLSGSPPSASSTPQRDLRPR